MKNLLFLFCLLVGNLAWAQEETPEEKKSPWLFIPLVSTNPKLSTAAGAMVAYITKFDEKSRTSMFGLQTKYSESDSITGGLFGKTSFGEDHHRITAGIGFGKINNHYTDYLETGQTVDTQDRLRSAFLRYLYRLDGNFFVGFQSAYTNYELAGKNTTDEEMIDNLGLVGFKSGGIGLSLLHDSRDNDFKPMKGWFLNANNIAYREAIAGSNDFDIYRMDFRYFIPHNDNVLGIRQRNQWSHDAPPGAFSPIQLRGYNPGEFLAQYMSSIEIEERLTLHRKWTSTFFTGVGYLYGDGSRTLSNKYFPAAGLGIQYIIKPKEGMVANLEFAKGRSDNHGLYLKMGYSF